MDGFIFVGTNFRVLKRNQTFVGLKLVAIVFSFIIYTENRYLLAPEFMDRTLKENPENWYPTKITPSAVVVTLKYLQWYQIFLH